MQGPAYILLYFPDRSCSSSLTFREKSLVKTFWRDVYHITLVIRPLESVILGKCPAGGARLAEMIMAD